MIATEINIMYLRLNYHSVHINMKWIQLKTSLTDRKKHDLVHSKLQAFVFCGYVDRPICRYCLADRVSCVPAVYLFLNLLQFRQNAKCVKLTNKGQLYLRKILTVQVMFDLTEDLVDILRSMLLSQVSVSFNVSKITKKPKNIGTHFH